MAGRWLLKTEPEEWSWEHQQANDGVSQWDGVRNALAQKHLRAMTEGDLCFFYHSGAKAKEIVGIARVCKTFYPDPSDPASKHGMIDIEAVSKLAVPLSLARLKQEDRLRSFIMFRQPRLSVVPVGSAEWDLICELAGQLQPPLPLDNGDAGLKICHGEARWSSVSSDDNANVGMMVCNDESRVSLFDNPSQPSTGRTTGRRTRRKVKSFIDVSRMKAITAVLTAEGTERHDEASVADLDIALNLVTQHEERSSKVCKVSWATEFTPESKRVYSRRNRVPRQHTGDGETCTSLGNVQSAVDQAAGQALMPKMIDNRAMDSDAGRVYKKRDRKLVLVESLLC